LSFREKLALPFLNKVTQLLSGFEPLSRSVISSEARNLLDSSTYAILICSLQSVALRNFSLFREWQKCCSNETSVLSR